MFGCSVKNGWSKSSLGQGARARINCSNPSEKECYATLKSKIELKKNLVQGYNSTKGSIECNNSDKHIIFNFSNSE